MSPWRRRILVVDDDAIVRVLVTATLEGAGFTVESCSDVEAARALIDSFDPDLVVLEASLGGGPIGVQFGSTLSQIRPEIALLYLTRYPTLLYADKSLATHVTRHGVLAKDDIAHADVLVRAVEDALVGERTGAAPAAGIDETVRRLNQTQLDILSLVAQGLTNVAIADQRGTRERTIERQLKAAYDSLGVVTSREQNARVVAAMKVAQALGWRQLSGSGTPGPAGLWSESSIEPHADLLAAAIEEWRSSCGPALRHALLALVDGIDDPALTGEGLNALFDAFANPSPAVSRAVELAVISAYTPPLLHEVEATLGEHLDTWLWPGRERRTRTLAAKHAFALGLALGYVTESWRAAGAPVDLSHEAAAFATAFAEPSRPTRLPSIRAAHLDSGPEWLPGEEWEAVFQATLDCVGELGFEASSVDVVAAASGVDVDDILGEFATMRDLFLQATGRMLASAVERNTRYQVELAATHPAAIADACMFRENMRPERRRIRTITLEQLRLAAHDPHMQEVFRDAIDAAAVAMAQSAPPESTPEMLHAAVVSEIAMTTGLGILAQLRSEAWRLPFDAVVVPWRRVQQEQQLAMAPVRPSSV